MNTTATKRVQRITDQGKTEVSWLFECPGCGIGHSFRTESNSGRPTWGFNGDEANPTFTPSLLVRFPQDGKEVVCHSFVRNGVIEFLNDCTHARAGTVVPLDVIED